MQRSQTDIVPKPRVGLWIDDSYSINTETSAILQSRKSDEPPKPTKKRARPGESTRPRPKDRQQIQDRVKELREIVPNGAKMIGIESGVVLKDNSSGGAGGGATWAYEVGGKTMLCPIIVEDLGPPGQMLVECLLFYVQMLCEERGFFLEIADIIRGFGLTILKGMMEAREDKIWARFIVEVSDLNVKQYAYTCLPNLGRSGSPRSRDS
ncbi:hypothetical protein GIB67_032715 [Kingdonia uniflora]|uniref:BHLH domain-containing protein n=1 Tax=Kingdonia uniflora TaxID=39325 RepID=A0A7J7MWM4_9MAGN|nr:hypothetical protein GIB67_032715 [Kingdonia uniflora]